MICFKTDEMHTLKFQPSGTLKIWKDPSHCSMFLVTELPHSICVLSACKAAFRAHTSPSGPLCDLSHVLFALFIIFYFMPHHLSCFLTILQYCIPIFEIGYEPWRSKCSVQYPSYLAVPVLPWSSSNGKVKIESNLVSLVNIFLNVHIFELNCRVTTVRRENS